jgi:hypothetical protein
MIGPGCTAISIRRTVIFFGRMSPTSSLSWHLSLVRKLQEIWGDCIREEFDAIKEH